MTVKLSTARRFASWLRRTFTIAGATPAEATAPPLRLMRRDRPRPATDPASIPAYRRRRASRGASAPVPRQVFDAFR